MIIQQKGIALIMVLVFLLLMTLISTTAIQQNSLQFAMIGNTQEQSQSFTHAENILKLVEQSIDQLRWSDARIADPLDSATNLECKETAAGSGLYDLIAPGTVINLGVSGATAEVQDWWCQNNPDIALADSSGNNDGVVTADERFGHPASCAIGEACPDIPTNGYAPSPNTAPIAGFETGCGTELYTIRVTFSQQNTGGAERIVESKYAVNCLEVGN